MTNGEIIKLYTALEHISIDPTLKFNFSIGYALAKNREILSNEIKIILELRRKIFNEFGTINEQGDIVVPKDKIDLVNQQVDELMAMENPISDQLLIIPFEVLTETENQLGLDDMAGLSYMIDLPAYLKKQEQ